MRGSIHEPLALPFLIYRVIAAILMLDLAHVDRDVENDLIRCIAQHPEIKADPDWLFWSLRVLQIAYGDAGLGRDG